MSGLHDAIAKLLAADAKVPHGQGHVRPQAGPASPDKAGSAHPVPQVVDNGSGGLAAPGAPHLAPAPGAYQLADQQLQAERQQAVAQHALQQQAMHAQLQQAQQPQAQQIAHPTPDKAGAARPQRPAPQPTRDKAGTAQ